MPINTYGWEWVVNSDNKILTEKHRAVYRTEIFLTRNAKTNSLI